MLNRMNKTISKFMYKYDIRYILKSSMVFLCGNVDTCDSLKDGFRMSMSTVAWGIKCTFIFKQHKNSYLLV